MQSIRYVTWCFQAFFVEQHGEPDEDGTYHHIKAQENYSIGTDGQIHIIEQSQKVPEITCFIFFVAHKCLNI